MVTERCACIRVTPIGAWIASATRTVPVHAILVGAGLLGCLRDEARPRGDPPATGAPVAQVTGLAGPEAVRYDTDQDVYFVANFNGEASGDSNGFISRVAADGTVLSLQFMQGTAEAPLHGPRGHALA